LKLTRAMPFVPSFCCPGTRSMARIRETIEMLDKREALCQKRIEMEVQKAKQFVQQKKKTSTFDVSPPAATGRQSQRGSRKCGRSWHPVGPLQAHCWR